MTNSDTSVKTVHITDFAQGPAFENGLFGVNTEITRKGYFGGLSAQLLNNRKFFAGTDTPAGWELSGEKAVFVTDRKSESLCRSNFVEVRNGSIRQTSPFIRLRPGEPYELKLWAKAVGENAELTADVCGETVRLKLTADSAPYTVLSAVIHAGNEREDGKEGTVVITVNGEAYIFEVSLMCADNYCGMRKDVIEALKYIAPTSVRFPGGCAADHFDWHQSLVAPEFRVPAHGGDKWFLFPDTYDQDCLDIGLNEFMMLCKELGAEPEITISLLLSDGEDAFNYVEYCNGSADTEFGAKRQALGFDAFNVKLWYVGNEVYFFGREYQNDAALAAARTDEIIRGMRAADKSIIPVPGLTWAEAFKPWNHKFVAAMKEPYEFVSYHNYIGILPDATQGENGMATCEMLETNFADGSDIGLDFYKDELFSDGFGPIRVCADEWNYSWGKPSSNGLFFSNCLQFHFLAKYAEKYHISRAEFFMPVNEGMITVDGPSCRVESSGELLRLLRGHMGGNIVRVTADSDNVDLLVTSHGDRLFVSAVNRRSEPLKLDFEGFSASDSVQIRTGEYSFSCNEYAIDRRKEPDNVVSGHSILFMTLKKTI